MGQKTNPIGFRLGFIEDWRSKWFARRNYGDLLQEDIRMRRHIEKRLAGAAISRVEIERAGEKVRIDLHTARPGIVIGRGGAEVDRLRDELQEMTKKGITINIVEIKNPGVCAQLVAESIAEQIKRRISYRRAMKRAVSMARDLGAEGVRVACAGRLGGTEISRSEWYREGRVPLHTLRARIDYGTAESHTIYGIVGVKVWIFREEVLPGEEKAAASDTANRGRLKRGKR